nr:theta defensin subunit A-like isoform X1 [Pongo pygmaeus]
MRTFALLTAMLLLVALQAQVEPLRARADETAAQEQPGADDQEMAHAFTWDESAALPLSGSGRGLRCICRRGICRLLQRRYGSCAFPGRLYRICCR